MAQKIKRVKMPDYQQMRLADVCLNLSQELVNLSISVDVKKELLDQFIITSDHLSTLFALLIDSINSNTSLHFEN